MQRELGEEDEARMLDVLSRTVSDQEVVSVQANQLSLFHVLVTQNFVNRCMTVEDVRKFDCFQVFHMPWNTKSALVCSEIQSFQGQMSNVTGQLLKKARSPLHNTGSTLLSDHFVVHIHVFPTRTFRANTSQQVSPCHHPEMECTRK